MCSFLGGGVLLKKLFNYAESFDEIVLVFFFFIIYYTKDVLNLPIINFCSIFFASMYNLNNRNLMTIYRL